VGANYLLPRPLPTGAELVAALEAQGSNVKFVALYDAAAGTVRLVALSGEAVPDKDFELWAIEGSAAPVSMGVIPIDTASSIALSAGLRAGLGAGTVLAVSLEPKGGSPTGQPTGPIVAQGAARAI
jgi:anti-sigma-K factor RskA